MAVRDSQITDQTVKGAVVGALSYFLAKANIDPGMQAAVMPVVITGLAWLSTKVGDPSQASFLAKAAKELPKEVEEINKEVAKKKAAAKKSDK